MNRQKLMLQKFSVLLMYIGACVKVIERRK